MNIFIIALISLLGMSHLNVPTKPINKPSGQDVGSLVMSPESLQDLIIYYEVTSKSNYNKKFTKPIVPAWQSTASGVTVGIGVDVGHMSRSSVDWTFRGKLPDNQVELLKNASGKKGRDAYYNALPAVKYNVSVKWDTAYDILTEKTLPTYSKRTKDAFKITKTQLDPHLNGALISLVYNRGGSMSSKSSRNEMRYIRDDIAKGTYENIPQYIRDMKRLWSYKKLRGLHLRRDKEAVFAQKGIDRM
jgi:hypothetical protein